VGIVLQHNTHITEPFSRVEATRVHLQDCTIEEQRGVVRILCAEGVKPVEIHRRMLAQYGQSTIS